jgi:D-alanine--poly(phosphoribitol) ligase subunit 1
MKFDFTTLDFIEQDKDADKLAVAASDGDLSWQDLRNATYQTRDKIMGYNLPKGHPVIIRGHKEKSFIATVIACIMLELPYIPVDIIYPDERLEKIRNITNSALLFDCASGQFQFNQKNANVSYYDKAEPLIYIIFTSGSTGEPKGVQISRKSIISFLEWIGQDFGFSSRDVFLNQAPFSFDLSVYELYAFMYLGASIVLTTSEQQKNTDIFLQRLQKYNCSAWVSTPSFAALCLLSGNFNSAFLPHLKTFLFCGETLPARVAKRLLASFIGARVLNSYGPTEATVATTLISITDEIITKYPSLPVGYPKSTSEIILDNIETDENGQSVGVIKIGGDNVMSGYFAKPEVNAQVLSQKNGKRFFYTGDYGYFKEGMLFFIGRRDNQVKLHGYRIEIDEIDAALHNTNGIQDAVTVPMYRNGEVAKLVSFIIAANSNNPQIIDEAKSSLESNLPYYMVPTDFMLIDKFPYNANHKICLKSLREIYLAG